MIDTAASYFPTMSKSSSPEHVRLQTRFSSIRDHLLGGHLTTQLDKPLAYWVISNDRGLPIALLDQSVSEILATSFDRLAATPGIGTKKLNTLLSLLDRISLDNHEVGNAASPTPTNSNGNAHNATATVATEFDPQNVSETQWRHWCQTIERWNLSTETLGRLASSLQTLPSTLWRKTFRDYARYKLTEIRGLKSHGSKRVCAIVSAFYNVNRLISNCDEQIPFKIHLVPANIADAEEGITSLLAGPETITKERIHKLIFVPLADQIQRDLGQTSIEVLQCRLGIEMAPMSVNAMSKKFGTARARIYQYHDAIANAMNVRWPNGRERLSSVTRTLESQNAEQEGISFFKRMGELFF